MSGLPQRVREGIALNEIRAAVAQQLGEADPVNLPRLCPVCGRRISLSAGRRSGKWFWKHIELTYCVYDYTGGSVLFDTEQEAKEAKRIFVAEGT